MGKRIAVWDTFNLPGETDYWAAIRVATVNSDGTVYPYNPGNHSCAAIDEVDSVWIQTKAISYEDRERIKSNSHSS